MAPRSLHVKSSYWQQQKWLQLPPSWQLTNEQTVLGWFGSVWEWLAAVSLHACAAGQPSPCLLSPPPELLQVAGAASPGPAPSSSSLWEFCALHWSQPMLCGAQQNPASCATGSHPLVLRHHQPQVLAQLSVSCSEDELLPHPLTRLPCLAWLPTQSSPSPAGPSLCSTFSCTLWLGLSPSPLLLPTALQESPYRGDISSIPWCLFSGACAGNGANYRVTSCSLKGIAMKLTGLD